jgi:hypothetical protein
MNKQSSGVAPVLATGQKEEKYAYFDFGMFWKVAGITFLIGLFVFVVVFLWIGHRV